MDVRKTVTDAGYIAIGLGVMGYQQTQIRRRELAGKLGAVPGRFEERGREVQGFLAEGSRQIGARGVAARGRAEQQVRATVSRVQELGEEVAERVVQVIEPVAARVRERTGSAA